MGHCIESSGHATDYDGTCSGCSFGNRAADHRPVAGMIPATNNGDGRPEEERLVSESEQDWRWFRNVLQQGWVELVCRDQDAGAQPCRIVRDPAADLEGSCLDGANRSPGKAG